MGSLAQISSGTIRRSFNTRFRARFRRAQKVPVQILRSSSRCTCSNQVPEGSGAEPIAEVLEGSGAEPI